MALGRSPWGGSLDLLNRFSLLWATMTLALIQKQYLGTVLLTLTTQQLGKGIWPQLHHMCVGRLLGTSLTPPCLLKRGNPKTILDARSTQSSERNTWADLGWDVGMTTPRI